MGNKAIINKLKNQVIELLKDSISQEDTERCINEIHNCFQTITGITGYDTKIEYMAAVPAAKGKALGLNFAAQCLLDYQRTAKFLRAIYAAINEEKEKNPGVVVELFYAGCGPYAPFLTLIAPLFTANEVQFSLLDINNNSLSSAKKLIQAFELSDYIKEIHLADAVTIEVSKAMDCQILISETLDALLYRECYVPILFNLLPQFKKDVILIPENVLINLSIQTETDQNEEINLLNVREALLAYSNCSELPKLFSEKSIELEALESAQKITLDTKVHIYRNYWLNKSESSLTLPYELNLNNESNQSAIDFIYQLEPEIELSYELK